MNTDYCCCSGGSCLGAAILVSLLNQHSGLMLSLLPTSYVTGENTLGQIPY